MITIHDLELGSRPRITEREFAQLRGCSVSTCQKERLTGKGPDFVKDPVTGRVYYQAQTVLNFLNRGIVCQSTSQYDTKSHQERLEKARLRLTERESA